MIFGQTNPIIVIKTGGTLQFVTVFDFFTYIYNVFHLWMIATYNFRFIYVDLCATIAYSTDLNHYSNNVNNHIGW